MEGEECLGLPHGGGALLAQHLEDGLVGHVALACGGKTAIEGYFEAYGFAITAQKLGSGIARAHGVTARGAVAYAVEFLE